MTVRPLRVTVAGAFPYPSPQGSQVYARGGARALVRAGHRVTVVCYGVAFGPDDAEVDVVRTGVPPGYRRLRSGPDPVKPVLDLLLARAIARVPADVVFAHNLEALGAALLARAWTGVPVVLASHTLFGEELPAYFPRGARPVAALGGGLDRLLAPRADGVVALSVRAADHLRSLGCRDVRHLPPGADPADFAGVVPVRGPGPTVVYAGNPDRYQDLALLGAAMRRLPDVRLRLVGPSGWPPAVARGAEVVPAATWEAARGWIAGADVAVVPRRTCAGFPVKLLNAVALGVPAVVAADSARGLPGEVVVAGGDADALAAGVRRALAGPRPDPAEVLAVAGWEVRLPGLVRMFDDVVAANGHGLRLYCARFASGDPWSGSRSSASSSSGAATPR